MGVRAAIYVRISQDRTGAGLGVARQEEDCRRLVERNGWTVVEVYVDNDVSASSGKPRPGYERMLGAVAAGDLDAVICWHVDRLTRQPRELEDVIRLHERYGVALATVTGEMDLSTPTGRMVARIMGSVARQEVEHKGERSRRAFAQAAVAGAWHGGTRPFGCTLVYDRADKPHRIVGIERDDREAALVVEAKDRALAGESLSSICRDWAARGIVGTKGKPFTPTSLRLVLIAARISGRREYAPYGPDGRRPDMGEIVSNDAQAPRIISPEDSDRLRRMLSNRRGPQGAKRRWPLSGVLVCGRCKKPMSGKGRSRAGDHEYCCPGLPGSGQCGRMRVNGPLVEAWVRDVLCTALDTPEMAERVRSRPDSCTDVYADITADEEELLELSRMKARREITMGEWREMRGIVEARIEANRRKLARQQTSTALDDFIGTLEDMRNRWEQANISQKRAIATSAIERIEVNPARLGGTRGKPRGSRFDTGRFSDPVWKV